MEGVRICYEVRFPKFFRELYKKSTDLNVILFYDVAEWCYRLAGWFGIIII